MNREAPLKSRRFAIDGAIERPIIAQHRKTFCGASLLKVALTFLL